MAQGGQITIAGNLGDDPEMRFTPSGAPVVRLSVGVSERIRDKETGQWRDGDTSWFTVIGWNSLAENCAETLVRGSRVVVSGVMKSRQYVTHDGEKRTAWEITADEIGASLRFASAQIKRANRARPTSPDDSDPWAGTETSPAPADSTSTAPAETAPAGAHEPAQSTARPRSRRRPTTSPAPA